MNVERPDPDHVLLELELSEGDRLANSVLKHAEEMPSAALDLANLLRQVNYEAADHFRQPPNPWDPGQTPPPSV